VTSRRRFTLVFAVGLASLVAGVAPAQAADPVIAAAGDIACDPGDGSYNGGDGTATACRQKYTSNLLVGAGLARVLVLGDNQYDNGTLSKYRSSYDPTWGRVKSITSPVPGNHEPGDSGGYFDYFNGVGNANGPAGPRGKGYYSYDIGTWHLIALNSNCGQVSCSAGSTQEQWLRTDLAAHPDSCKIAYWHHARFSSGHDGDNTFMQPIWQALYDARADIVLNGHSHDYERFAPMNASGNLDTAQGIREFVVGVGGAFFTGIGSGRPNSLVRRGDTYGVLKLTLHPAGYDWQFAPEAGKTFSDTGAGSCHSAADLSLTKADSPDPVVAGDTLTYNLTIRNNGPAGANGVTVTDNLPAGVTYLSATPSQGSCAQASGTVSCNLGAIANGGLATVDIDVTPQSQGTITNSASVQGAGGDPAGANNSAQAATVVEGPDGYARPKGASPTILGLVPAYAECAAGSGAHGAPRIEPSCGPPSQTSSYLTVGTPDANGRVANSVGFAQFQVLGESPIDPTNGDQADVRTTISLTDVLKRSDLSDYAGELDAVATLRVTDRYNGPNLDAPATVTDLPFRFTVGCAPTVGTEGGACQLTTTVDALMPGVAREGVRAIWELLDVAIYDGGADGLASSADNTLFASPGLFAP
jgi:uncharacterized repeat protein (TIGR01451 family)